MFLQAKNQHEDILVCDCKTEYIDRCPARKLFLPDSRPELYEQWLQK